MKLLKIILPLLCSVFLFVSCGGAKRAPSGDTDAVYTPEYAEGFEITACGGGSVITVRNPWQGAEDVAMFYYLDPDGKGAPGEFAGTTIRVPVQRVVCMSSTYIAFIDALDGTAAVKGVSGADYISNETVRKGYADGTVRDVGFDSNLNYEAVAAINPDVVLIYGVGGENTQLTGKLAEMGVRTMYIGDYAEESPLGKAEWIVAFGELLGKREAAEEIFDRVRDDYEATRSEVAEYMSQRGSEPSSVMFNAPWRDVWIVPGGRSYMVRLVEDAGGVSACGEKESAVSRPVSSETAFVYASRANVWLNPGSNINTLADLRTLDPRFASVPALRDGQVYNSTRRRTPAGGSDFWETGAVRPDIVLRDLAAILHPDLDPGYEPYFYERLK